MADFACGQPSQCGKIKRQAGRYQRSDLPNLGDPVMEDRAMAVEPYNIRSGGLNPEQNSTFKSIGELAADLVRKAGAQ